MRLSGERANRAGVERAVVWLVALAIVAGTVGSVVYLDDSRQDVPDSEFAVEFDAEAQSLTVRHAGGDPIRDRGTEYLRVVVADAETNASRTVTWAGDPAPFSKRGSGFPIERGTALRIDDAVVDSDGDGNRHDRPVSVGFELTAGDSVRVVWRGARRTGAPRTVTLASATLG